MAARSTHTAPAIRTLAAGEGWQAVDYVCAAGPHDRPFEERHDTAVISAVIGGTFTYRGANGRTLLHPGVFLLGNAGACFECGHEHGVGDRCVAVHYAPDLLDEIAAGAGQRRFRFPAAMLPALPALTAAHARTAALAEGRVADALAAEEFAFRLAEAVIGLAAGAGAARIGPYRPADSRRIGRVLRHIEAHADERLDLAGLAAIACMSRFHFLRTFRRVVGLTPHRYVLALRLRRAALGLAAGDAPVASVAYDAGFADLSGFNRRFRAAIGAAPLAFRRATAGGPSRPSPGRRAG
jgi:AraC family transcriptional regulator